MPEDDFRRVAIIGLGLIGGSLGLALREAQPHIEIVGWDLNDAEGAVALNRGAITIRATTLPVAVQTADLIVVATPVLAVRGVFEQIAPHLQPGALVTDVASTKAQIVAWAAELLPAHAVFVGGHPMAGGEQHGVANARADLFRDAVYCLTPTEQTPPAAVAKLEHMITSINARPLRLDPQTHDEYVAAVSHVPFMLAAALVAHTSALADWSQMHQLAATGYRDTTRLASGDARMHTDICLSNAEAITDQLRGMARLLDQVADHLDDPAYLQHFFDQAKHERDAWLAQRSASAVASQQQHDRDTNRAKH
jgi:prephenate dehydrogenase